MIPDFGFEFQAMGTVCHLRLCAPGEAAAAAAAQLAIDEVRRLEAKYSRYRPDSIVSRINASAGTGEHIAVDPETAGLLGFADKLHEASEGRFDITSGILRRVWDFKAARVPSAEAVAALLPDVGWPLADWDGETLALQRAGMELDFGGFAKEYAADRAAATLHAAGIAGGTVNLGGDVSLVGPHPTGVPWKIGIAHPRRTGEVVASIDLAHGALATSGDYERSFEVDGRLGAARGLVDPERLERGIGRAEGDGDGAGSAADVHEPDGGAEVHGGGQPFAHGQRVTVEEVEEEVLGKGVVPLGVLRQELVVRPQSILQPLPGGPAPPLVEDVVAE